MKYSNDSATKRDELTRREFDLKIRQLSDTNKELKETNTQDLTNLDLKYQREVESLRRKHEEDLKDAKRASEN